MPFRSIKQMHFLFANHPEMAKRWADEAVEAIQVLPSGSVRTALELFAQAVVDRQQ